MYGSGAGGLGWGGGAALGVKLAKPGSFVCAVYVRSHLRQDLPDLSRQHSALL